MCSFVLHPYPFITFIYYSNVRRLRKDLAIVNLYISIVFSYEIRFEERSGIAVCVPFEDGPISIL
jgi:hypothetical protein